MPNVLRQHFIIQFCVILSLLANLISPRTTFARQIGSSAANVIINEVLANEPGSSTKLEWVELYNPNPINQPLEGWIFVCKDDTTSFPTQTVIPSQGFLIIVRQLVSTPPDSISFEGHWGDGSGVWGDSPEESFPVIEAKMSLTNSGGSISLIDPEENIQTFTWEEDCGDGVSLERVSPEEDIWLCCCSSDKSTPGKKNSVSVAFSDKLQLNIEPNPFSPDGDSFEDETTFRYTLPMESNLTIKIYDLKGRLIKSLIEDEPCVSGKLTWDGKDDDGRTARIGIYVVWAEVTGNSQSQIKTTIVVARKR